MTNVLTELKSVSGKFYFDGEFQKSESIIGFNVIDPATELVIGNVLETTNSEIDMIIERCNATQKRWWKEMSAVDDQFSENLLPSPIFLLPMSHSHKALSLKPMKPMNRL